MCNSRDNEQKRNFLMRDYIIYSDTLFMNKLAYIYVIGVVFPIMLISFMRV